jgi:hypothetical protein
VSKSRSMFLMLAILLVGSSAVGLIAAVFWTSDYDIFDKFEVIGTLSDPDGQVHAVSYRYDHANSSRQVFAVWALPRAQPIGSTQPVRAFRPPIVFSIDRNDVRLVKFAKGRLHITVPSTVTVRQNVDTCYFEYDQAHLVCIDPKVVEVSVN